MKHFLFSVLCCYSTICNSQSIANEFKKIIIPIKSTSPQKGLQEFLPIQKYVNSKKIIAIGEANHGTKEFFEFKTKMV
ncbi:MAG: hypothetical protein ACOVNZ_01235, partial [Crocinitomicaceae bacterium]